MSTDFFKNPISEKKARITFVALVKGRINCRVTKKQIKELGTKEPIVPILNIDDWERYCHKQLDTIPGCNQEKLNDILVRFRQQLEHLRDMDPLTKLKLYFDEYYAFADQYLNRTTRAIKPILEIKKFISQYETDLNTRDELLNEWTKGIPNGKKREKSKRAIKRIKNKIIDNVNQVPVYIVIMESDYSGSEVLPEKTSNKRNRDKSYVQAYKNEMGAYRGLAEYFKINIVAKRRKKAQKTLKKSVFLKTLSDVTLIEDSIQFLSELQVLHKDRAALLYLLSNSNYLIKPNLMRQEVFNITSSKAKK